MARVLFVVQPHRTGATHRLPVIRGAANAGYEVAVATQRESEAWRVLEAEGFPLRAVPLTRSGMNPLREGQLVLALRRLFREVGPDLIHTVSIKPVIFGGIAARAAPGAAVVSTIPGLGHVYSGSGWKARLLQAVVGGLYRLAFRNRRQRVIFQNPDDQAQLGKQTRLPPADSVLIRGSGVDTEAFRPPGREPEVTTVVLVARMLAFKGVREYVAAARRVKAARPQVRFLLVGGEDPDNPAAIPRSEIEAWVREGVVAWLGEQADMRAVYQGASLVVLPSYYREGLPKVLLEAAACARPIITTDSPGCREAVVDGETGYLIPVKDAASLFDRVMDLVDHPERARAFGEAGRRRVEAEFATERVVAATLSVYHDVLSNH